MNEFVSNFVKELEESPSHFDYNKAIHKILIYVLQNDIKNESIDFNSIINKDLTVHSINEFQNNAVIKSEICKNKHQRNMISNILQLLENRINSNQLQYYDKNFNNIQKIQDNVQSIIKGINTLMNTNFAELSNIKNNCFRDKFEILDTYKFIPLESFHSVVNPEIGVPVLCDMNATMHAHELHQKSLSLIIKCKEMISSDTTVTINLLESNIISNNDISRLDIEDSSNYEGIMNDYMYQNALLDSSIQENDFSSEINNRYQTVIDSSIIKIENLLTCQSKILKLL